MEAQETVKTKSTFREYAEAIGMALLLALVHTDLYRSGVQDTVRLDDSDTADRRPYLG